MTKYISIFLFCTVYSVCNGQQTVLAKFIIKSGSFNRIDETELLVNQKAFTVFYKVEDGDLYMANFWLKNNSPHFLKNFYKYQKKWGELAIICCQ